MEHIRRRVTGINRQYHTQAFELINLCRQIEPMITEEMRPDWESSVTMGAVKKALSDNVSNSNRTELFMEAEQQLLKYSDILGCYVNVAGVMGDARRNDEMAEGRLRTFQRKLAELVTLPRKVEVDARSGHHSLTGTQHSHKLPKFGNKDPLDLVLWMLTKMENHRVSLERNPYMYRLPPSVKNWRKQLRTPLPPLPYGKVLEDIMKEEPKTKSLALYVLDDRNHITFKSSQDEPNKLFGNIWEAKDSEKTIVLKDIDGPLRAAETVIPIRSDERTGDKSLFLNRVYIGKDGLTYMTPIPPTGLNVNVFGDGNFVTAANSMGNVRNSSSSAPMSKVVNNNPNSSSEAPSTEAINNNQNPSSVALPQQPYTTTDSPPASPVPTLTSADLGSTKTPPTNHTDRRLNNDDCTAVKRDTSTPDNLGDPGGGTYDKDIVQGRSSASPTTPSVVPFRPTTAIGLSVTSPVPTPPPADVTKTKTTDPNPTNRDSNDFVKRGTPTPVQVSASSATPSVVPFQPLDITTATSPPSHTAPVPTPPPADVTNTKTTNPPNRGTSGNDPAKRDSPFPNEPGADRTGRNKGPAAPNWGRASPSPATSSGPVPTPSRRRGQWTPHSFPSVKKWGIFQPAVDLFNELTK